MARVRLEAVVKHYGAVTAVNEVSLEMPDGEMIVLVGPSGCGKTTTLRMIAGLEEITSGKIYIGDRLVNDVSPKSSRPGLSGAVKFSTRAKLTVPSFAPVKARNCSN